MALKQATVNSVTAETFLKKKQGHIYDHARAMAQTMDAPPVTRLYFLFGAKGAMGPKYRAAPGNPQKK